MLKTVLHGAVTVALAVSVCAQNSGAQSTWDRYRPGSLTLVIHDADSAIRAALNDTTISRSVQEGAKHGSDHFLGDDFPTLATVTYTGQSRPIDQTRRELIDKWGRSFRRDSTLVNDFHREYLFKERDTLLWLPVQDAVASFFPKELRPGQLVSLYVMLLGGSYKEGAITWAFIVNEFRAGPAAKTY